jgi:hypothetical protein
VETTCLHCQYEDVGLVGGIIGLEGWCLAFGVKISRQLRKIECFQLNGVLWSHSILSFNKDCEKESLYPHLPDQSEVAASAICTAVSIVAARHSLRKEILSFEPTLPVRQV